MVECVQSRVATRHAHRQAIGLIDETSFAKKGEKSPGVQRQHCGSTGKVDNCVVSVHLGYVAGDFHALLDGDVYLPESWLADRERCEEAGVPPDIAYRTKPQIAVEQLARAVDGGVSMAWLCADEQDGRSHEFRLAVADLGIHYVAEVPCNLTGWLASRGTDTEARRLDQVWRRGGPAWETWEVKETEKGPAVWQVRAARFFPREEGVVGDGIVTVWRFCRGWVSAAASWSGLPVRIGIAPHMPRNPAFHLCRLRVIAKHASLRKLRASHDLRAFGPCSRRCFAKRGLPVRSR